MSEVKILIVEDERILALGLKKKLELSRHILMDI